MDNKERIKDLKEYVDALDKQMIEILGERLKASRTISELSNIPVIDKKREKKAINTMAKLSDSNDKYYIETLIGHLQNLSSRRNQQKRYPNSKEAWLPLSGNVKNKNPNIAYEGNKSAQAAAIFFPHGRLKEVKDYKEVIMAIKNQDVHYGVLLAENERWGADSFIYNMLLKEKCYIVQQVWIKGNKENGDCRFMVIADTPEYTKKSNITSVIFRTENRSGALADLLLPFLSEDISLYRIESRQDNKGYYFLTDIVGNIQDKKVDKALKRVESLCGSVNIVGCYDEKTLLNNGGR
ncbi:MAG: chorismate mutase [Chloroflexi bacterium]|nr:chorismate mutase [Chloroflexota bacterium]